MKWLRNRHSMSEPLQAVATELEELAEKEARGLLLLKYQAAIRVRHVLRHESEFGWNAINQLACYLGVKSSKLYELKELPAEFSAERLKELAKARFADGGHITFEHLVVLLKVKNPTRREELLRRVFDEGLTPRQLDRFLRKQERDRWAAIRARVQAERTQGPGTATSSCPQTASGITS